MARYYFHTTDGTTERDTEGMECADLTEVRQRAIRYARDIMSDEPEVLWDGRDFRVEATNEAGDLLFTIVTLAVNAPAGGDTK